MVYRIGTFCTILCAGLIVASGCSKKVLKVEPQTTPAVQQSTPKPQEALAQSPSDSFVVADLDTKMKGIFVPIYFAFDKSDLSEQSINSLGKIAAFLQDNASVRILIEGNADELGSEEYNIGLGEKRAKIAKNYLVHYGIKDSRIEVTSYGKERPAVPNCPPADDNCRSKNRRDEWKALGK
jgi:peptidoglycan-associated lipoprotein